MFKIKIICLGKFKEKEFKELELLYMKRLSPYAKLKIVELQEVGYKENEDLERVKEKEATNILKYLDKESITIVLEEKGTERDSMGFANFIERVGNLGQELVFVIGGSLGIHSSLRAVSNYQISLSKMTFTHNFARILLEEQLYRACMIIAGKNYHK